MILVQIVDVNLIGVVLAAVAAMIVGFVWYSPILFGKQWMKMVGMKESDVKAKSPQAMKGYAVSLLTAFLMAYVLAHFLAYAGAITISDGLTGAFWAWLGFVLTTQAPMAAFEKKPAKLFFINVGHYLAAMLAMGVILVYWG